MNWGRRFSFAVAAVAATAFAGSVFAAEKTSGEVVVYTSVDEIPAQKVLDEFEKETGIKVKPLYDTEATKTTGLAVRLASEMSRPQADVFWNNELSQTHVLAKKGAFAPYASPSAADVPDKWKEAGGLWASTAMRARVIVYNSELVSPGEAPRKLTDLLAPKWKGKVGVSDPRFGTMASHTAALAIAWGREKALDYFRKLEANGVKVYAGNSVVRDAAASGEILVGLTDTDDVLLGQQNGMKIGMSAPDQEEGGLGTLVFADAVSLVAGAPHEREGKRLVDYLLSREVERRFADPKEGWIAIRETFPGNETMKALSAIKPMEVDWEKTSALTAPVSAEVGKVLIK